MLGYKIKKLNKSTKGTCILFLKNTLQTNTKKFRSRSMSQIKGWMRSSRVARAPGNQCHSRNYPGSGPSILQHSEYEGQQMKQC
jgi:hypothetical protein